MTEREINYRKDLHRAPNEDHDQKKTKATMVASGFLILYGLLMPPLLINYYVIPYQRGMGQLLADGSVNLLTGESILAMLTAPVYIILGLIVVKVVSNRYHLAT